MNKYAHNLFLLSVAGLAASSAFCSEMEMKPTHACLFKNGYGRLQLQGVLPAGKNVCLNGLPDSAVFGSLWWKADDSVKVNRLYAEKRDIMAETQEFGMLGFLAANQGKMATFWLECGEQAKGVFEVKDDHLVVKTEEGIVVLDGDIVRRAKIHGDNISMQSLEKKEAVALTLELEAPAPGKAFSAECLSFGLSWAPSYRLELGEADSAQLFFSATVVNDLIDLEDVQLELVFGYPALGDTERISPMLAPQDLKSFLGMEHAEALGRLPLYARHANNSPTMMTAHSGGSSGSLADSVAQKEDLFFYGIPAFSCPKGGRVCQRIFSATTPLCHVYAWNVPEQDEINRWLRLSPDKRLAGATPMDVWHCVRLKNNTGMPWTAGVAECQSGGRLVACSQMEFTPVGASALLKLNKTLEAPVSFSEVPISKKQEAGGKLVRTMKGTLGISNNSARTMEVEVNKTVAGEPVEASDHGSFSMTVDSSSLRASRGNIKWSFTLAPGEKKELQYAYLHTER